MQGRGASLRNRNRRIPRLVVSVSADGSVRKKRLEHEEGCIAATVTLFLASFPVQAAQSLTCDQATLIKVEADIGSMSGDDAKKASKQLDRAKQALKEGKTRRCANIMKKLQASLKSSSKPAAEGAPPADQGAPPADQGDENQGDSMQQ